MQKISRIYSQKHHMHPTARKPSNSHHMHSLHDPWAKRRAGSTNRPHISTPGAHIPTPARSHNRTRLLQLRTTRNTLKGHTLLFLWLHAVSPTEHFPQWVNVTLDLASCPPDHNKFSIRSTHSYTMPVVSSHSYTLIYLVVTCINRLQGPIATS